MLTRRTLLQRVGAIVACLALAPEIAFNVRLNPTRAALEPWWVETRCISHIYSDAYIEWRNAVIASNPEYLAMLRQLGERQ